ncbi:MAG: ABC transporter permease [Acidimicrobiia bacterium]|nr:ABC transporter permease [Acidimicrobiia bacterium]
MVLVIILVLFALLAAWVVRVAGARFAVKRLGGAVLILVIVTFGTTLMLRQVPGDPCITALGTGASDEAVAECTSERGLDDSVVEQYTGWVGDVVTGDLGFAFYKNREPLSDVLEDRAPRTAWLFLYSQLIALTVAVPLGIWAAYQSGRAPRGVPRWILPVAIAALLGVAVVGGWGIAGILTVSVLVPIFVFNGIRGGPSGDSTVNTGAFVLLSIPVFVLGETLRYFFAIKNDWYDLVGYSPWNEGVGAHISSIWLPALVLGLAVSPVYLRLLRADMVQNLQQDFVAVAKAKGMSNRHILLRHVLRPSTLTLLTVAGLNIAQLVNGAIVVEFIFDFDGVGSYLIEAVARREFFAVQTLVALVAVLFVVTNTVIDVVYTTVDPRVRAEDEK